MSYCRKYISTLLAGLALTGFLFSAATHAGTLGRDIVSKTAEVDGIKLHYLTAGHGPALILLHGYTQTSHMWRPIMPSFSDRYTVIAPDLPGIGESEIPASGIDMKFAAIRIHDLVRSLNVQKAAVVGHDIGLMVAYAYAAQFPTEVEKLVVMDAFLPGVRGMGSRLQQPGLMAFPLHRADACGPGAGTRACLFRLLLERFCR